MKDKLISKIAKLKEAVENEDIPTLIECMRDFKIDTMCWSLIYDFTQQLLIQSIKDYMLKKKKEVFKVKRIAEYQTKTEDWYTINDGILHRNGCSCRYTTIGKLYVAYKKINKME